MTNPRLLSITRDPQPFHRFICNQRDAEHLRPFLMRVGHGVVCRESRYWFFWRSFVVTGPDHVLDAVRQEVWDLQNELRKAWNYKPKEAPKPGGVPSTKETA